MCNSPPQKTFNNNSLPCEEVTSRWDATPPPSRPSSPDLLHETSDAGFTTTIPMPQRVASWGDIAALVDASIEILEYKEGTIDEVSSLPSLKTCQQDSPLTKFFKTMSLSPMPVVTDNAKVHATTEKPTDKGRRRWSYQSNSCVLQRSRRSTLLSHVIPTRSSLSCRAETNCTDTRYKNDQRNQRQNEKWSLDDEDISSRMIQPPKRLPSGLLSP